jgi:enoyl-CoA hydratase/long-chain 3-hydroxyacyl-CoA dehydrogenase
MITAAFNKSVKKRRMTAFERDATMGNIVQLGDEVSAWKTHFSKCDMIIEAVFEDIKLKHTVIGAMEEVIPEHCVFATNTSALSVAEIATASKRPENVIGMHYFSPVPKMPLLEVITHDKTSDEAAAATVEVGLKQGKTVIVVKDVPGFYVNRSLGPYMAECMALLQMGVETDKLDKSLKKFGYPVGPIALLDEVGIDVAQHVQESLAGDLGDRMGGADVEAMNELVASGMLGRKTKEGFFTYDKKGKKTGVNSKVTDIIKKHAKGDGKDGAALSEDDIQHRMAFRFINEAVLCLQDGIIESARDGDIGAVFGIGFPPFRGGPFRFVDDFGAQNFVDRMHSFRDVSGAQFEPCQLLKDMAAGNKKFHE